MWEELKHWTHRPFEGLTHWLALGRAPGTWLLLSTIRLNYMRLMFLKVKNGWIWLVSYDSNYSSWKTREAAESIPSSIWWGWMYMELTASSHLYSHPISCGRCLRGVPENFLSHLFPCQSKFYKGMLWQFSLWHSRDWYITDHTKAQYGLLWSVSEQEADAGGERTLLHSFDQFFYSYFSEQIKAQSGDWKTLWTRPGFKSMFCT